MARRRKSEASLANNILELVKVRQEETEKILNKLPYTVTPRPDDKPPKKGKLWCPYCAKWTVFKSLQMNGYMTYRRAECCGISIEDFHVKTVNKLW